jgi:hypothetical protein
MNQRVFFSLSFGLATTLFAAEPPEPKFRTVEIDNKIQIGYGLAIADVDGDGKPDILLADKKQFVWYKNPTWEKFVLAENLTKEDNVCIAAMDIDGDGKCEIAVGAGWNPGDTVNSGAVFYLVAPKDRKQMWEAIPLHHEPTVHRMKWVKNADGKYDLVVVPLHGRGNKNGEGDGVKVLAYKMPADPKAEWKTEVVDDSMHLTHNFQPTDSRILVGGKEGIMAVERRGKAERSQLVNSTEHSSKGVGEIRLGKLANGKGFMTTVEPMHGDNLVVYTSDSPKNAAPFKRAVLDPTLVDGHALACADFLGTGSDQIVVGWRAMNKPKEVKVGIKLFAAIDADGKNWRASLIDDNGMACEDLVVADLNGDGKPDIIAAGRATKNVKIYFNESGPK